MWNCPEVPLDLSRRRVREHLLKLVDTGGIKPPLAGCRPAVQSLTLGAQIGVLGGNQTHIARLGGKRTIRCATRTNWCRRQDSNLQNLLSESSGYAIRLRRQNWSGIGVTLPFFLIGNQAHYFYANPANWSGTRELNSDYAVPNGVCDHNTCPRNWWPVRESNPLLPFVRRASCH